MDLGCERAVWNRKKCVLPLGFSTIFTCLQVSFTKAFVALRHLQCVPFRHPEVVKSSSKLVKKNECEINIFQYPFGAPFGSLLGALLASKTLPQVVSETLPFWKASLGSTLASWSSTFDPSRPSQELFGVHVGPRAGPFIQKKGRAVAPALRA